MNTKEYNIYGLIKIITNIKILQDYFWYFRVDRVMPAKKTIRIIESKYFFSDMEKCERIGYFFYNNALDAICWKRKFPLLVQIEVGRIDSDEITVYVTKAFIVLPTVLRGNEVGNIVCFVMELINIKLLDLGFVMFHAVGIVSKKTGKGLMIPAFPNTGKTTMAFRQKDSHTILSDEYMMVNENNHMLGFPTRSALSKKTIDRFKIKLSLKEMIVFNLIRLRAKLIPLYFGDIMYFPFERFFPPAPAATLTKICFLQNFDKAQQVKSDSECYKKLCILTEAEFPILSNWLLQSYSYMNNSFDLFEYQTKRRSIISRILKGVE